MKVGKMSEYLSLPMVLVALGAILSATGGFIATYRQNHEKVESALAKAESEKELRLRSDEIAELNKKIAQSITGGDSYCYVSFVLGLVDSPMMTLVHEGDFPSYDVSIRIWEPANYGNNPKASNIEDVMKKDININIGNMSPRMARLLGRYDLRGRTEVELAIQIGARNGFTNQTIVLRRIDGTWKGSNRVRRANHDGTETPLLDRADDGFQ